MEVQRHAPAVLAPGKGQGQGGPYNTEENRIMEGIHDLRLPRNNGNFLNMYRKTRSCLKSAVMSVPITLMCCLQLLFLATGKKGKGKGKAVPLQTWSGPEGS
jgi:hypothetical protein